jgi:excisionase family DNA binding protein
MATKNTVTPTEHIIDLKKRGLRNCQIARELHVSRQYVSRVCRSRGYDKERFPSAQDSRRSQDNTLLTSGAAGRILGVSAVTIRRWADEGKIPCFRIDIGRKDRRFNCSDLELLKRSIKTDS